MRKKFVTLAFVLLLCGIVLIFPANAVQNGKIAFTRMINYGVPLEIAVMNPDGTGQTLLTSNQANDGFSSWSPDGTKITFSSDRDGNSEIYWMNADGTGQYRLTNNNYQDSDPAWSPDTTKIAFTSNRDGNNQIYVMNADGTGQLRRTNNNWDDKHPAWSPNAKKIVYSSFHGGEKEILIMNADGTGQAPIANFPSDGNAYDGFPAWSPDGTKITFVRDFDIWIMNADGTGQTKISGEEGGLFPEWSPDGTKIVFSYFDIVNGIAIMNPDGTERSFLTHREGHDEQPSWAPAMITINAAGSGVIGDYINISGTNTISTNTYLYVMGPNLNPNGILLGVVNVVNGGTWDFAWFTATSPGVTLDPGTYTIYGSATPIDLSKPDTFATVSIVLKTPWQSVQDLRLKVDGMGLPLDVENGLMDKLNSAQSQIMKKKNTPARNVLSAFINQVNAQKRKALTTAQANELIVTVQRIIYAIPGK